MSDPDSLPWYRHALVSFEPVWLVPRSLLLGTFGAVLFQLLGLPIPWLTGALLFSACANLSGIPIGFPNIFGTVLLSLLGITMGTGITPDAFQAITQWPVSAIGLIITVVCITYGGSLFFQKVAKWDRPTAFMASLPGAMAYVAALVESTRADQKKVIIAQALRVFFLVFLLPPILLLDQGSAMPDRGGGYGFMSLPEIAIIGLLTMALGWGMTRLRIPAAHITAGLIVCGAANLADLVHGGLPTILQDAIYVAFGCFIGSRFMGSGWRSVYETLAPAIASIILMSTISFTAAFLISLMIDISLGAIMLAFVPGGLEAMIIISLALDLDPVYVTAHHLLRMLLLIFTMPLFVRFMKL